MRNTSHLRAPSASEGFRLREEPRAGAWGCRAVLPFVITLLLITSASAQSIPQPTITVADRPNDAGTGLVVRWTLPATENAAIAGYELERAVGADATEWKPLKTFGPAMTEFVDQNCKTKESYRYRLIVLGKDGTRAEPVVSEAVSPTMQWIDRRRLWFGGFVLAICGSVIVCTQLAKRGQRFYIRPIAGLTAIQEAVGRATEMGRPVLYVPGIQDLDQSETVAGVTVLAHVAQTVAEYDATLEVPTSRSLVMTAAQEAVQAAYLTAGRADSYNADRIYYVTDEQFGYVAYVCGWMAREKPAACFYLGKFYAESLVLSEVGNSVGAIQIAGTAEAAQLPFFVAACDYTLIGEELFAASAYLSNDPEQLGTLKGQDVGKLIAGVLLIGGCLLATWAGLSGLGSTPDKVFQYVQSNILSREGSN